MDKQRLQKLTELLKEDDLKTDFFSEKNPLLQSMRDRNADELEELSKKIDEEAGKELEMATKKIFDRISLKYKNRIQSIASRSSQGIQLPNGKKIKSLELTITPKKEGDPPSSTKYVNFNFKVNT